MARTAVVAGTATAVSRGVSNRMNRNDQMKYEQMQAEQQQPAAPMQQAPAAGNITAELEKLSNMKTQGILSSAE